MIMNHFEYDYALRFGIAERGGYAYCRNCIHVRV